MPARKPLDAPTPELVSGLAEIDRRLVAHYGEPEPLPARSNALDGLIGTILSQHTSDVNSAAAFRALIGRFPSWTEVLASPVEAVAAAIRAGGLANLKAQRIQQVLGAIKARYGSLDLDWLAELPLDEARAALTSLPGVGPKTAACVLLFNLRLPALPVDTHVHRVAGRLGLLSPGMSADAAHAWLEALKPPDRRFAVHLSLIRHGREVCHARNPRCDACPLLANCPFGQNRATPSG